MAVKPLLAVGCAGGYPWDMPLLQKFDSAGNPYAHGHRVYPGKNVNWVTGVALTASGHMITTATLQYYTDVAAQAAVGENAVTTVCRSAHGDVRWSANHGAPCLGVTVDPTGNVYTFGDAINAYGQPRSTPTDSGTFFTTRKYSPSGTLLWSADHGFSAAFSVFGASVHRAILYHDGYVYTAGFSFPYSAQLLTKTDAATGDVIWRLPVESGYVWGLAVDLDGNIVQVGSFPPPGGGTLQSLRKHDPDGVYIAGSQGPLNDYGSRSTGRKVVVDSAGHIIAAMSPTLIDAEYRVLFEYDENCLFVAHDDATIFGRSITGLAIDADDTIYLTHTVPGGGASGEAHRTVRSVVDLSLDWQVTTFGVDTADVVGNACDAICIAIAEVETPPLRFKPRLAVPTISGDAYVIPPALPLRFTLGQPLTLRDYVGAALPVVWRLAFPDDPDLSLSLRSVQIRRVETTTALTLVVSIPDAAGITALEDQIGADMTLYRGFRFPDGHEQIEPMATVPLSGITADVGSNNASATLTGALTVAAQVPETRRLRGISYRNTRDGKRRVRCAVDTFLQPGTVADLGDGETFTVGEITIFADADSASMEVTE